MSNFDTAIITVLKHEGTFVNDPDDDGGATNFGISLRWLKSIKDHDRDGFLVGDLDHDGTVDINDIKKMSKEDAIKFYRNYWWDKYGYEKIITQSLATKVFDLSVNMGSLHAHKCLQRAVRASSSIILIEDGLFGNKSFEAINSANPEVLIAAYRSEAAGFYRSLDKPKYINGWLNRAYA